MSWIEVIGCFHSRVFGCDKLTLPIVSPDVALRMINSTLFGIFDILENSSKIDHLGSGPFWGRVRPTGISSKQIRQSTP